jgi:hypothetical protein
MKISKHIAWLLVAAFLVSPAWAAAQDAQEAPEDPGAEEAAAAEPAPAEEAPPAEDAAPPAEEPLPPAGDAEAPPMDAEEPEATPDDFRDEWITLGLRAGVYVPTIINEMTPHADLTFEVGLLLPFLDRMLSVVADVSWAPPGRSQELTDPRIGEMGDGAYSYSMETHHLMVSGGLLFRFLPPGSTFVPYLSAVGRVYFLETNVEGEGEGEQLGRNTEQSTQGGFAVSVGGELRLGPGALLLDVSFGWSDLPHRITGGTNTGSLGAQLGYRLFL